LKSYALAEEGLQKEYDARLKEFVKRLQLNSKTSVELTFLKNELSSQEGVLARITERLIALQTERDAPARVIWHQPAKPPEAPVELLPYRSMALAGLGGLCLPYAAGLFALVLWKLRKPIHKLEPVETDVATPPASPSQEDPE